MPASCRSTNLLGLSYQALGPTATIVVDGAGANDTLVVNGTPANDVFDVAAADRSR